MNRRSVRVALLMGLVPGGWAALSALPQQHDPAPHRHAEAQAMVNPLGATSATLAAGRKLYGRYCSECHGDTGEGDGMAGEGLEPPPANLTDDKWQHGPTDGEIFAAIREGTGEGMKAFKAKITEQQTWELVTFVRSLAKPKGR